MDFRNNRPVQPNTQAPDSLGSGRIPAPKPTKPKRNRTRLVKIAYIGFLIAIAILLLAMVLSIAFAKDKQAYREGNYVRSDRMQAVFLNGGQVYFGKITDLNSKFLNMSNIYYLRVNQQVQPEQQNGQTNPNNVSLVKLGCELHGPEDSMVINREQIIFWENLKTDGQVAKAVEAHVKANPDGQKCNTDNNQQNNSQSGNNTLGNTQTNQNTPATTPNSPNTNNQ